MIRKPTTTARYLTGDDLFSRWRDDVHTGMGPLVFSHSLPAPALVAGQVTLIGGAPGAGKTALIMQAVVEALRANETLRAVVCNVEMTPTVLLDRQLARLSGVPLDVIRHRKIGEEHAERIDAGLSTVETFIDRLAFLEPEFDLRNIAHTADAHRADIIVADYIQRVGPEEGDISDPRLRANSVMDTLRRLAMAGGAVVAVSAVGRSKDSRGRSSYAADALSLASFRDSGELEFGADDAYILAPVDEADRSLVRLAHLKARHDDMRSIDLGFDGAHQSFTFAGDSVVVTPAPRVQRQRANKPKGPAPDPAFSPERLAALWGSTPAASDEAVAIDDDEGNR
jgi:replicative DNA helicase